MANKLPPQLSRGAIVAADLVKRQRPLVVRFESVLWILARGFRMALPTPPNHAFGHGGTSVLPFHRTRLDVVLHTS
jgi:hypothetical protein